MKGIYILYKTVRIETGEYYIGVHSIDTDRYPDFNDGYLGSGNILISSVKKHGKKAFKRSILAIIESRKEAEALEAAMVTVEMIGDPLCLNLAPGGRGGVKGVPKSAAHCKAIGDSQRGVPKPANSCQRGVLKGPHKTSRSVEYRQKQSDSHKGKSHSDKHCQAISEAKKGVPGPKHSSETRQKMSDAQKERWRLRNLTKMSDSGTNAV